MRKAVLAVWLLLPIGAFAYHEGPGQDLQALEEADAVLERAHALARAERYPEAVKLFEEALRLLPAERTGEARRVRLACAEARMLASELPRARADLERLVEELQADPAADGDLLAEARRALAGAHYYMTWLMRLEGLPRERWEPEIEAARQIYRLLAEEAQARGDETRAAGRLGDLEAAVRLARMDLQELQGLPLPSQ